MEKYNDKLLDCRIIKNAGLKRLKDKIDKLDYKLGLAVIQIGDDESSLVYINHKKKVSLELGIDFRYIKFSSLISKEDVINTIISLNNDENIDGILIQMPIGADFSYDEIISYIDPNKDVDGFTDMNIGRLFHNKETLVSCTSLGIISLLDYYNIDLSGKNVVIIGRSDYVAKPLMMLLVNRNATVSLCHSYTRNLKDYTTKADVVIVCVGKPNFIDNTYIKKDSVVIDVGINRLNDNSIVGDVNLNSVIDKVSYITPVPFGIGQMTILTLFENLYKASLILRK